MIGWFGNATFLSGKPENVDLYDVCKRAVNPRGKHIRDKLGVEFHDGWKDELPVLPPYNSTPTKGDSP